jgi:acetoin utilization protein AcuC
MGGDAIFLHSPELERVGYPEACPFNTARAGRTRATVQSMGLLEPPRCREVPPRQASRADLLRYHTPGYLDVLERAANGPPDDEVLTAGLGTPDCPIFDGMSTYASWAAGATLTGARLILDGAAHAAFNPSGGFHHAMPDRAAGFCYVNDVVLAAMVLAEAGKRVLFLDIDVHHADGVQHAFYARQDVMVISMHESGETLFPGTGFANEIGEGAGRGYTVNVPLPVGTSDVAYERAFREAVWPLVGAYDPDVIMVELGMDGLAGDPLAHLHLTNNVHADILKKLVGTGKPILATGGGGYNVENTVRGWALCWSVLCGEDGAESYSIGMGGVMLGNTDWLGGLRDRCLISDAGRHDVVDAHIRRTVGQIKALVFPLHGLA